MPKNIGKLKMNKRTVKSIVVLGVSSVIGYLITMFLTSYITENIGIEAYGFVSIAKTLVNYSGIITVALTSFIVRYVTIHYHKNELHEANSYYVSSINASLVLCFLLTIIYSIVVLKLEYIIKIPCYLIYSVKLLFIAVLGAFVVNTISTPFSTGFYIANRLDLVGIIKIISYLSEIIIVCLLFVIFEPSIWFVGVGTLVAAFTILLSFFVINNKLIPSFKYNIKLHSNRKVKTLLVNGIWNSINQLGNALNSGLDLLISNAMLSGMQTGQIAVAKIIGVIFATLSSIIFQPLQPDLLRTYSNGVNDKFLNQLKKSMKVCGIFSSLAFSGFGALGVLFFKLWLPSQNSFLLYILTILTVFTYIMDIFLQPLYFVSTLTVKNKLPCFVTIVGGMLNVSCMFLLIKYTNLGIYSVPVTTLVIMSIINCFFNPIYASRCLNIKKTFFYPLILRHLIATGIMCVIFKLITCLLNPCGWLGLVCVALFLVIIGAAIYGLSVLNHDERTEVINKFKKLIIST